MFRPFLNDTEFSLQIEELRRNWYSESPSMYQARVWALQVHRSVSCSQHVASEAGICMAMLWMRDLRRGTHSGLCRKKEAGVRFKPKFIKLQSLSSFTAMPCCLSS